MPDARGEQFWEEIEETNASHRFPWTWNPARLFLVLDQNSLSHRKLHPNFLIGHYLDGHSVINVIFFAVFPGSRTLVLLFFIAAYEDYIWLSSALPIVLLSHGSQKALSNYNLARFLQGWLKILPHCCSDGAEDFWRFCVWINVCVCSAQRREVCLCVCVRDTHLYIVSVL